MAKPGTFKKGNKAAIGNKGGHGRSPDWLKQKCREIVERDELIEFLGKVARGDSVEQVVTSQGEVLPVPAPVSERRKAALDLIERGWGKVKQEMDHTITDRKILLVRASEEDKKGNIPEEENGKHDRN